MSAKKIAKKLPKFQKHDVLSVIGTLSRSLSYLKNSRPETFRAGLVVFVLGMYVASILLTPKVWASTSVSIDTDTDFNLGSYSSTQVNGSGSGAYLSLAGGDHWWNSSYSYRRPVTVDIGSNSSVSSGYAVKMTISGSDAAAIYSNSKNTGDDFRVAYWNGSSNSELSRYLVTYTSSSIVFYFKLQATLNANNSSSYSVYYGNASASSPPADPANVFSTNNIATSGTASASDSYAQNPVSLLNDGAASGSVSQWGNNNTASSRTMIKLASNHEIWKVKEYWGGNDTGGWAKPAGTYFPANFQIQYSTNSSATATDAVADGKWTGISVSTNNLAVSRTATTDYVNPVYGGNPSVSGTTVTTNMATCTNCWGTTLENTFVPVNALSVRLAFGNTAWVGGFGEFFMYPVNDTPLPTEPTLSIGSQATNLAASGTWTSGGGGSAIALTSPALWGNGTGGSTAFSAAVSNVAAGDTVQFKLRHANTTGALASASYTSIGTASSGSTFTLTKSQMDALGIDPASSKYIQIETDFAQTNGNTPQLDSMSLTYASDPVAPISNASNLQIFTSNGGSGVTSNGWVKSYPYLSWTAASDDASGTGIKGYCLYLGTDNTADPTTTKGYLGTSPVDTNGACQFAVSGTNIDLSTAGYIGSSLPTSTSPYYLVMKPIDYANNVYSGATVNTQFRYDNTPPVNPLFVTAPSQFVSDKAVSLTWPTSGGDAPSDTASGLAGLQYRIGSSGTWYGDSHSGAGDTTDLLNNDGSYTMQSSPDFANLSEGNNLVYFRTWDAAGNVSSAYVTTVIKINTSSPSTPQNVTATPSTNTTNSFGFSWLAPASYGGQASNITYCYTVNATPSSSNCTFTAGGVTSLSAGAYATQPGDNTLYVVAKDEAGNINYATAASTTFTANTAAPGIPQNIDVADISVKTTSNWKLALSWEPPTQVGAGVASYKVYRSTDNSSFSQVASTAGTSYVDSGLTQQTYYYKVKACDSANNCGALTSSVSKFPTGKFTSAATLLKDPQISNLSTKKASVSWVTDRSSDSKVAFGTRPGTYSSDEIANSDQVTSHTINLVNLSPGTTYYMVTKWTDEDGNTGTSNEVSFTTLPAPAISNVTTSGVNISNATINFTSTSADSVKIYYGKSKDFGATRVLNTSITESTYSTQLVGLDDGTTYYYRVNPFDADGNEYTQTIFTFTTPSRPRITNLRFQPVPDQPTSTQQITWDTNVPSTSELAYGPNGQAQQNASDPKLTTNHSVTINALNDNTEYSLIAQSRDSAGNLATSDKQIFHTALDTRPPKISGLKVTSSIKGTGTDAAGQIIVSWKTDEPATSQVAYGEGSDNSTYNTSTAEDRSLVTDHAVVVSNLSTSQIFHLQALSKDSANNQARSDSRTTIIGNATDSVISIIFNALQKVFGGF
jgi:hypothetical protein